MSEVGPLRDRGGVETKCDITQKVLRKMKHVKHSTVGASKNCYFMHEKKRSCVESDKFDLKSSSLPNSQRIFAL